MASDIGVGDSALADREKAGVAEEGGYGIKDGFVRISGTVTLLNGET